MGLSAEIYQTGNAWQKLAYRKMSDYFEEQGVTEYGKSKGGASYKHLLSEKDSVHNFLSDDIYKATINRFSEHKAGDVERVKQNTVASQTYCFNLFVPLQINLKLASELFSTLLSKKVEVKHIDIEFTPNTLDSLSGFERKGGDESIGDQSEFAGTDADVAVFYKNSNKRKGVILIEFKFIEAEFSVCSSYRTKKDAIRPYCNSSNYWEKLVEAKDKNSLCGYTRYENWVLTSKSKCFDAQKIKDSAHCPFRFSLNQLWRNMLLAEKVEKIRQLDESYFLVFSPSGNDKFLWNNHKEDVEESFRSILSKEGNKRFCKFHLEDVVSIVEQCTLSKEEIIWISELKNRYFINQTNSYE